MAAPEPNGSNPWKDIQNVLGFLLAGFAGVLGFLGLGSVEVSSVLRNASLQASLVALMLLLSVLAAVFGVIIDSKERLSWPWTVAIFLLLFAAASWVIYETPTETKPPIVHGTISKFSVIHENISLIGGIALGVLALVFIIIAILLGTDESGNEDSGVRVQPICILASVILLATSVYGAMRLEAYSQGASSVQISANVSGSTPHTTLSIHVTGFKIRTIGSINIITLGLPSTVSLKSECHKRLKSASVRNSNKSPSPPLAVSPPRPPNFASCIENLALTFQHVKSYSGQSSRQTPREMLTRQCAMDLSQVNIRTFRLEHRYASR
jgi:hypothetical protein